MSGAWAGRAGSGMTAAAALTALAGCGADTSYRNTERPPSPINVTAVVNDERIVLSPRSFGAGPVVLIVSNQSSGPQAVTFATDEPAGEEPGLEETTRTIDPRGTAQLQIDVRRGDYGLKADDRAIRPVSVTVGKDRPSGQSELLQP